jgi:hypothetical protein
MEIHFFLFFEIFLMPQLHTMSDGDGKFPKRFLDSDRNNRLQ